MANEKKHLSDEERALIDHEAQINGEADPHGTRLADGRTVAEAQAAYAERNNKWEAERLRAHKAKLAARKSQNPTAPPQGKAEGVKGADNKVAK